MLDTGASLPAIDPLGTSLTRYLEGHRSPAERAGQPLSFIVTPLWDGTDKARTAQEAIRADEEVCYIGCDGARIVIGPIVGLGGAPCRRCMQLWAPSLGREPRALALPAPFIEALAVQVMVYAERWRDKPAGDSTPIWWIDADTLVLSEHRLSPHPECDLCGSVHRQSPTFMASERPVNAVTWRAHDRPDSAVLAKRLVDARFGLVRQFERETEAIAHPMTFAAFVGRSDPRQLEIGVGRSGCQALDQDVAILEALERFSSFRPRGSIETVTARYTDVSSIAIDPRSFILPNAERRDHSGFELAAFDAEMPYEWTWAHSFRLGKRVLIPLQFLYYDLPFERLPAAQRFVSETSNGCALGTSAEEAALFGLFEVLERDAYLTTWYGQLIPGRLHANEFGDPYIAGMIARIEAAGFAVSILDVGVGFPITTLAVLAIDRRVDASAASHLSTGAHLNPIEALRAALVEVCTRIQHRPAAMVAASHARAAAMLLDDTLVRGMDDHASLYAYPGSLTRLDFLTAGHFRDALPKGPSRKIGAKVDLNCTLSGLTDAVLAVANDILVADLSNALTLSVGLHCVKVLAPGLLPVTFGHQYRRVSGDRIAQAATATGRTWDRRAAYRPHNFQ